MTAAAIIAAARAATVAMCRRVADAAVHALIEALRGEGTEAREDNESPAEWGPTPRPWAPDWWGGHMWKEGDVVCYKAKHYRRNKTCPDVVRTLAPIHSSLWDRVEWYSDALFGDRWQRLATSPKPRAGSATEAAEALRVPEWSMWTVYEPGQVVQCDGRYFQRTSLRIGLTGNPQVSSWWGEVRSRAGLIGWEPVPKEGKE